MYEELQEMKHYIIISFLKEPSFHVSIAWAPGDVSTDVTSEHRSRMSAILDETLETCDEICAIQINELKLKTGNRIALLPLS